MIHEYYHQLINSLAAMPDERDVFPAGEYMAAHEPLIKAIKEKYEDYLAAYEALQGQIMEEIGEDMYDYYLYYYDETDFMKYNYKGEEI